MQLGDPFKRSRYYLFALWLGSWLLIILGIYLSKINFLQTEWLSRAGCIIVILGILSSLGVIIQERLLAIGLRIRRRKAMHEITVESNASTDSESDRQQKIEHINQLYDKQRTDMTQKLKLSFGFLEVSSLITGTFLWGFGDLIMRYL